MNILIEVCKFVVMIIILAVAVTELFYIAALHISVNGLNANL